MKKRLFNKEHIKSSISDEVRHFKIFLKWTILSIFIGVIVGSFSSMFGICMAWANDTRVTHDFLIFLLPLGGLFIVWLYHFFHFEKNSGTN